MIFVDTGSFFAFFSANDPDHARCRAVFETFKGQALHELFLTTDHVVFETLTLTRSRIGHDRAVFVGERLYSEKMARIHDKNYSAIDCLSFVVMEKLGITEALAIDDDFTHRFTARPGPRPK